MIDNLGDYGKITQASHAAGGVNKFLTSVGAKAVAKAAPRLRAQGVAAGAVLGVSVTALFQFFQNKRKAVIAEGTAAEAEIRRIVSEAEEQQDAPTSDGEENNDPETPDSE